MEPVSDESLATADSAESADLGRSALTQFVGRQFCALVMDPAFPCRGARSAVDPQVRRESARHRLLGWRADLLHMARPD